MILKKLPPGIPCDICDTFAYAEVSCGLKVFLCIDCLENFYDLKKNYDKRSISAFIGTTLGEDPDCSGIQE